MARIVLGVGTSHSPMLNLAPSSWPRWGTRDAGRTDLTDQHGVAVCYADLEAAASATVREELSEAHLASKAERCKQALDHLRSRIASARLDAVIVIGDDQAEHLHADNLPAMLVYHGATIRNTRAVVPEEAPPESREHILGYYEPEQDRDYPVAVDLAGHLIEHLLDQHFDIAASDALPKARAEGHALQFAHRRLLPPELPVVPLLLNTYLPPTQPRAARCYDLGAALADGVRDFARSGRDFRIGVLASGGLSHFVVHEQFDRRLLEAFEAGDVTHLRNLPEPVLQAGTSEVKCWIAAAGACRDLSFGRVDYVPAYRTGAGTGVGLGFGVWQ